MPNCVVCYVIVHRSKVGAVDGHAAPVEVKRVSPEDIGLTDTPQLDRAHPHGGAGANGNHVCAIAGQEGVCARHGVATKTRHGIAARRLHVRRLGVRLGPLDNNCARQSAVAACRAESAEAKPSVRPPLESEAKVRTSLRCQSLESFSAVVTTRTSPPTGQSTASCNVTDDSPADAGAARRVQERASGAPCRSRVPVTKIPL
eukprot:scaffold90394_cov24-Tisochrysis_lutea.AAC.5